MTIRQNIKIDTLEDFRTLLDQKPETGKLHLEAKAVYEGQAGRSMVYVGPVALDDTLIERPTRHYTFPFGASREVEDIIGMEDATDRVAPVEMVVASIAACLVKSITLNAARLGIDTAGLEIIVHTTIDPRPLLALKGPDEYDARFGAIEYDVKVSGDVSDEDMEMIYKLCKYSPVHAMMAESINITGEISRA
jgi:uncharacterized OsmC-like protein